ncbi:MAG: arsenate reductase [Chlorobi bacterium]|nr:arsenate reductase [Chlorobiota bacterium]
MNTVFYIKNCNTSKRVIKELGLDKEFVLRDIKENKLKEEELDELARMAGSYQALFSKKARKYREYNLHLKELSEVDYKKFILEDYTFLKRPTVIVNDKIFIGSHKNTVKELAYYLSHTNKPIQI